MPRFPRALAGRLLAFGAPIAMALVLAACQMPPPQSEAPAQSEAPPPAEGVPLGQVGTSAGSPPPPSRGPQGAAEQTAADRASAQALAQQCSDLASQLRSQHARLNAAPSTSINEDIVAAAQAKADKRIAELEDRYNSLGCPSQQLPSRHSRTPQLPPAPGRLPP